MNYRPDRYGNQLSVLGFGCMRFPTKAGRIDMAETEAEIMTAIRSGVNYFDTATYTPEARSLWARFWSAMAFGTKCTSPPSCPIT